MTGLNDLYQELNSLEIQKQNAEVEMSKQKNRSYELGFWWGTYCMIDHQIDKVQLQIKATKRAPLQGALG
jgi:hypothetical protein